MNMLMGILRNKIKRVAYTQSMYRKLPKYLVLKLGCFDLIHISSKTAVMRVLQYKKEEFERDLEIFWHKLPEIHIKNKKPNTLIISLFIGWEASSTITSKINKLISKGRIINNGEYTTTYEIDTSINGDI